MEVTSDFQAAIGILGVAVAALLAVIMGLRSRARQRESLRAAAAKLYSDSRATYSTEPEYRLVSPEDFPGISRVGYQEHERFLVAEGFGALGAMESLAMSRIYPDWRTYQALYVSGDQRTVAVSWCLLGRQFLNFGCATSDGRFLLTTNAEPNPPFGPTTVDRCILPADTAPPDVLLRHRARILAFETRDPSPEWLAYDGIEAVLAGLKAHAQQLADYRRSVGYVTLDDLLAQARNPIEERGARRLWAEIERQRRDEA